MRTADEIAEELQFLANLAGVDPSLFTHNVVSASQTIPAAVAPASVVAACINDLSKINVIDVTAPAVPVIEATVPVGYFAGNDDSLYITGSTLFGLGDDDKLYVVDMANPAAPVILSSVACYRAGSGFYRMVKVGDFLAIIRSNNVPNAAKRNTLQIFDVSNLAAPVSLAEYNLLTGFAAPQLCGDILMHGNIAVVTGDNGPATFAACMGFYNFSALPVVTQIGVTVTDVAGTELDVFSIDGDYAYCAALLPLSEELRVYNISAAPALTLTGVATMTPDFIFGNRSSEGIMYAITLSTLNTAIYAWDAKDPLANPAFLGASPVTTNRNYSVLAGADATGQRVYLATRHNSAIPRNRAVQIYDASIPGVLVLLGEVIYSTTGANSTLALLSQ